MKYNPQEHVSYLISFIHITDKEIVAIKPMTLEDEALFEVEKDNFYAEPTVYSQMAAKQICLLLASDASTNHHVKSLTQGLANWRSQLAKVVPLVLQELPLTQNESRKIIPRTMFPLFSPNCFQVLYKLFLGLLLTKGTGVLKNQDSEAEEASITLGVSKLHEFPGVLHPVLTLLLDRIISDVTKTGTDITDLLFLTSNSFVSK